jgi:hypothetical protein
MALRPFEYEISYVTGKSDLSPRFVRVGGWITGSYADEPVAPHRFPKGSRNFGLPTPPVTILFGEKRRRCAGRRPR